MKYSVLLPDLSQLRHSSSSLSKFLTGLARSGRSGQDLDNLAKPVLDTLFKASVGCKYPELTGALFACDDCVLADLRLQSVWVDVSHDEGVDIEARW